MPPWKELSLIILAAWRAAGHRHPRGLYVHLQRNVPGSTHGPAPPDHPDVFCVPNHVLLLEHFSAVHFLCGALNATNGSLPSCADQNVFLTAAPTSSSSSSSTMVLKAKSHSTMLMPDSNMPPLTSSASGSDMSTVHQSDLNLETKTKLLDWI